MRHRANWKSVSLAALGRGLVCDFWLILHYSILIVKAWKSILFILSCCLPHPLCFSEEDIVGKDSRIKRRIFTTNKKNSSNKNNSSKNMNNKKKKKQRNKIDDKNKNKNYNHKKNNQHNKNSNPTTVPLPFFFSLLSSPGSRTERRIQAKCKKHREIAETKNIQENSETSGTHGTE